MEIYSQPTFNKGMVTVRQKNASDLSDAYDFVTWCENFTPNKIIGSLIKRAGLNNKGYMYENTNYPLHVQKFIEQGIIKEYYNEVPGIRINYSALNHDINSFVDLNRLFISDGKSDKDLINLLITSYRDALFINYDITIREIEKLIEIKKNNFDKFYYVKDNDNSYFSSNDGCIHMDDSFASTIIHETGHALHYYLNSFKVPDNYDEIVKRARENKELLIKVSDYFEFWNNFKKNLEKSGFRSDNKRSGTELTPLRFLVAPL